ncbi:putative manganese-dependent inorganic diphosphatase [Guggenheimella bovis]
MTLIFGHKNPDTDSIVSATALSYLKNVIGEKTKACRLGAVNKETEFIFKRFQVELPEYIEDVKSRVMDVDYSKAPARHPKDSIFEVFQFMLENKLRTAAITDEENTLVGVVTMEDMAMSMIQGDIYTLNTNLQNLEKVLNARTITKASEHFSGSLNVASYYSTNEKLLSVMNNPRNVLLVGDRLDVIEKAIEGSMQLLLLTGNAKISDTLIERAKEKHVTILSCDMDTYTAAKRVSQANFVESIMTTKDIKSFVETAYLDVAIEEIRRTNFSGYPIVDKDYKYLGLISRKHILFTKGKNVILVDHNESEQTAEGIEQATILEIYDHHKIGDISTKAPIIFKNYPWGSTSTIIYTLYKEKNVPIPKDMAGLLFSGIISDTLNLTSPTATFVDELALVDLAAITGLDRKQYALELFKAGTLIGDSTIEELFHKDYKIFEVSGKKLGIGQIYTLDIESLKEKKDEIKSFLCSLNEESKQFLTMLVVTDIYAKGSYVFYVSKNERVVERTFGLEMDQGVFVPGVVSRKKQIVPQMMNAIMNL